MARLGCSDRLLLSCRGSCCPDCLKPSPGRSSPAARVSTPPDMGLTGCMGAPSCTPREKMLPEPLAAAVRGKRRKPAPAAAPGCSPPAGGALSLALRAEVRKGWRRGDCGCGRQGADPGRAAGCNTRHLLQGNPKFIGSPEHVRPGIGGGACAVAREPSKQGTLSAVRRCTYQATLPQSSLALMNHQVAPSGHTGPHNNRVNHTCERGCTSQCTQRA